MITSVIYILECDHVMPGGRFDREVFCGNCNEKKAVKDVHVFEWKVTCNDCSFARWAGLAKAVAEHFARAHVGKYPEHTLKVLYLRNPSSVQVQERVLA